ncbi:class C sortase [Leifsonia sp. H3M29-4]|uniref:class C sortase n=1 Tax=Salinibacterium metalliresistens TaxID=3031321 RepID=UPI0023DC1FED|nr:class C sortase [Salinibacterium metalliresistens]MDF1479313.1 class C sortase [Salinibacterium metalliresistens]
MGITTRTWEWPHTIVVVVATLGVGVMVYPSAASWFSSIVHHDEVAGYVQSVESLPATDGQSLLDDATAYNEALPDGPIRDPFVLNVQGEQTAIGEGSDAYFQALVVPGTDVMARIRIPSIGVDLPIYHGTDDATLARGIGHIFGSALPVGGDGTHAVLTGHNGFAQATLFDDIDELDDGDLIIIKVLGRDLYYEVDQQLTVLPNETDELRKVPGHDYLTLVTCTPTGVNTHRLLVRAERVDAPSDDNGAYALLDGTAPSGFPWWAVALIATPIATLVLIRPRRRRAKTDAGRHVAA